MKLFNGLPLTAQPPSEESHCTIEDQSGNVLCYFQGDEYDDGLDYERASRMARCLNACQSFKDPQLAVKLHSFVEMIGSLNMGEVDDGALDSLIGQARQLLEGNK